jgi:hypothetical protein
MATVQIDRTVNETSKDEGDHIYFNVNINADDKNKGFAVFDENRVDPILQNPSLYDVSIIRFLVPAANIPIFIWKDDKFYITLTYKGVDYISVLEYVPNVDPSSFSEFPRAVWNYGDFIRSINKAFEKSFIEMKLAEPLAPYNLAPRMVYNPETRLNSLFVEPLYSSENNTPDKIEVWFNLELGELFRALDNFGGTPNVGLDPLKIWRILFIPNITNEKTINGVQYLIAEEEYSTLFRWSDLKSIIFETDMPVISESNGAQKNIYRQILTDFEPAEEFNDSSAIQFFPQGLPRFYEMTSTYPLKRVSVRVSWEDRDGNIRPIFLSGNDTLTCKLYFKRKGVMIDF